MDVLPVLAKLVANCRYKNFRLGHGRACVRLSKVCFKRILQLGNLDSRVAVGALRHFHRGRLQPPQDILHRVGGLNGREILREIAGVGVRHPIEVVDRGAPTASQIRLNTAVGVTSFRSIAALQPAELGRISLA